MRDSRIFKVRSVIITAIVLVALVVTAATVAILAASANVENMDDVNLGVTFDGCRVNLGGTLEVQFLYSDLGEATHVVTEVQNTNTNKIESAEISVSDLATVSNGGVTYKVVSVEIPAARITDTVTVYPKKGNSIGVRRTTSIPEYANTVLASDDYADYHEAMKAILNYGAMAQRHFGVNVNNLANDGLYVYGNPANSNTGKPDELGIANTASYTDGSTIKHNAFEAVLTGSTSLRLYFTYSGEGELTASVSRAAVGNSAAITDRPVEITFVSESEDGVKTYYAEITGISAKLYATSYTLKVTDGTDNMTYTARILDYVRAVLSSEITVYTQRSTVTAMYRMYAWMTGNTPNQDTCSHKRTYYESAGENTCVAVCSACGKKLDNTVSSNANMYLDANYLGPLYNGDGLYNLTDNGVGNDNGVSYYSFGGEGGVAQLFWTRMGYSNNAYWSNCQINPIEVEGGRYLVFKMRMGDSAQTSCTISFGTAVGDVNYENYASTKTNFKDCGITVPVDSSKAGEWQTYVLDIRNSAWSDAWQAVDGKYNIYYLQLTFYGQPAADTNVDLAYIAVVDDWSELKAINGTENVNYVYANSSSMEFTADGCCADAGDHRMIQTSATADGVTTYSATCKYCGMQLNKSVPSSVNVFTTASAFKQATLDSNWANNNYPILEENGEQFVRVDGIRNDVINGGDNRFSFMAYYNTAGNVETGKYFVFKYRMGKNGLGETKVNIYMGTINESPHGEYENVAISASEDDEWHIAVIDIEAYMNTKSGTKGYVAAEDGKYYAKFAEIRPFPGTVKNTEADDYFDVAYAAFCDDLGEVSALIGEDTATVDFHKSLKAYEADLATGECKGTHNYATETKTANDDGDTVYTYTCICGKTVTKTVDKDVNKYLAPLADINTMKIVYNWNGVAYPADYTYSSVDGDNAFVEFYHDSKNHGNNDASQLIFSRLGYLGQQGNDNVGAAKFYVLKLRVRGLSNVNSINFSLATKYDTSTYQGTTASINLNSSYLQENTWQTVIVPITSIMSSGWTPNDDGTYTVSQHQYTIDFKSADVTTYFDLGYIAFVDTYAEAISLVDTDTVGVMTGSGACQEYAKAADPCASGHTYKDVRYGTTSETFCTICGESFEKKTVPESASFYSANYINNATSSSNVVKKGLMTDDDGTAFVKYKNESTAETYGESYPALNSLPANLVPGTNKYIVFKMRTDVSYNKTMWFRIRHNNAGENHAQVLQNAYGNLPSVGLTCNLTAGEWKTFVIDMTGVSDWDCELLENGKYPELTGMIIQLYLAAGQSSDVAYVAFCNDWTAIDALVDETTVEYHNGTTQITVNPTDMAAN